MLKIGDALVTQVEESVQPSFIPNMLLPDCTPDALAGHMHWMAPLHFDVTEGRFRTSVRSYLVKTGRHTILIDTCGGNDKNRPYFSRFHLKQHDWIARLAKAGVQPDEVDFVMCTHLHADHVGWNTEMHDGHWRPTFPNAKYIIHRNELDRWNPAHRAYKPSPHNEFTWEDSVLPVIEAGQAVAVDDGYTLDDMLHVEPMPGHTLAHVAIRLNSRDERAIFSGDVMHVPLQIHYPHWGTSLDDDPRLGVRTRLRLLESCAENHTLICRPISCRTPAASSHARLMAFRPNGTRRAHDAKDRHLTAGSIPTKRLVTRGSDPAVQRDATLSFESGLITEVQSDTDQAVKAEYPDTLIVPALSNAHDHGRGLKTLAYGAADTAVEAWVPATYTIPLLDPYLVSAAAFARMARAGITSIVHCQLSGPPMLETAGAVARAARDVGVRVAFVVPLRDRARLGYGADEAILAHMAPGDKAAVAARWLRPIAPIAEQLDLVERIAEQHAGPTFAVQYGPVGMEWCSDELLGEVAARAGRSQRRIHMHLLESRYQREWTDRHYPDGPVARLAELGLLSPRLTLAHGTWLRPAESSILAAHGVTVSVNTSSNLRLKSGIAPVHDMKSAKLQFAIGLDALALDDDDDMLRELRLTHLLHAGHGFDQHVSRADVFGAACHAGACVVCGDGNAGELVAGAPADFIVLNYKKLAADIDGRLDDPFVSFFTRARQDHIASVYCAGRAIVRDGRVLGLDQEAIENELAGQLAAAAPDLVKLRPLLRSFQQGLERFYASGGHKR